MTNRDESDLPARAGKDAALSVLLTLLSIILGANPVPATLVGASGPAAKYLGQLWAEAGKRRGSRAERALEHAADIMDVGIDIFVERATSHDARLELLAHVLEAAARTSMEDKIRSLGQVLADGLRAEEDSALDEARLIVAMVNDLEAPHVMVLQLIGRQPLPPESMWASERGPRGWERQHLALALPEYAGILDGLLAALLRHGALRTLGDATWSGIVNNYSHGITPLGIRCLQLFGHEPTEGGSDPA